MSQVVAHLHPELAKGPRPRAVLPLDAGLHDVSDQIQILVLLVPAGRGGRELRGRPRELGQVGNANEDVGLGNQCDCASVASLQLESPLGGSLGP